MDGPEYYKGPQKEALGNRNMERVQTQEKKWYFSNA